MLVVGAISCWWLMRRSTGPGDPTNTFFSVSLKLALVILLAVVPEAPNSAHHGERQRCQAGSVLLGFRTKPEHHRLPGLRVGLNHE